MVGGSTVRRRLRAAAELSHLSKRIGSWEAAQLQHDAHKSQVRAIAQTSGSAAKALTDALDAAQWEQLPKIEEAAVWAARFFEFFAAKFEQRAGEGQLVLTGADEVLWSCRQSFLLNAGNVNKTPPAVAYLEHYTTPLAVAHNAAVPAGLRAPVRFQFEPRLRAEIERFPVPLLQLPSFFVRAPWSLIYVGHEAGHFLIADLGLRNTLDARRPPDVKIEWIEELIADAMWLLLMGEPVVDALCDELWDTPANMALASETHPPAALRLRVLLRVAAESGILGFPAAEERMAALPAVGRRADALVALVLSPLYGGRTLPKLLLFDPATTKRRLTWWQERLREDAAPPKRDVELARFIAAAAYAEWVRLSAAGAPDKDALKDLCERLLRFLPLVAPEGDRAPIGTVVAPDGKQLAETILSAIEDRLRAEEGMGDALRD